MTVESYFENHKEVIKTELSKAKEIVLIAVAWINFKEYQEIFNTVINNKAKLIIVCSDNWQNRSHQNEIDALITLGADIRLLKMPSHTNHMHHKFSIVDSNTILNGSFNWSPNATRSFENIVVIRNFPEETTKFISEFDKLCNIESKSIKELQKIVKCTKTADCKGELFNILVFSEKATKYHEVYGDVIEVCPVCSQYKKIKECIPNNQIEFMLSAYRDASDDFETELIDRDINNILDSYVKNSITIHAIGRVKSGFRYKEDEFEETNIIWKNKFIGNRLPDKFEEQSFGVAYE